MAVLNAWQKITRVIPGLPWGDGASGAGTVSSDPNTRATASGTATSTSLTIGSAILSNGDLFVIHQTRGTGAGQWEVNMVASGGGGTSITCSTALNYTYATSGASAAQVIKVPRYTTASVSAHSVTAWNGSTGGVEVILAKTSITVSGALTGTGLGFLGATQNGSGGGDPGDYAEGTGGARGSNSTSANGNGGGGGASTNDGAGGGGGGNAASGSNGLTGGGSAVGAGGAAAGAADGTSIVFGGGGGGGGNDNGDSGAGRAGGNGAAIFILISKSITLNAGVVANGNAGGSLAGQPDPFKWAGGGGGGAGGSILFVCETASLGSAVATATAGAGGAGGDNQTGTAGDGGTGSVGRIAVQHSGSVTGTTNPTFTDVTDASLVELTADGEMNYAFFM